jgi:sugar lactone lactonase YvrE
MTRTKFRVVMILLTLALTLSATAATQVEAAKLARYILPGTAIFPEGIAYQQGTGQFYVSSSANGTIYRGDVKNEAATVYLPGGTDGRTSATGMKVDKQGRLFVSGGATGLIFIYDTKGNLIKVLNPGHQPNTFINDVIITRDGTAYFTDSVTPVIYRVMQNASGEFVLDEWLNLAGSPIIYQTGFNLNGIEATPDGKYLVTVQSNTGKLFRIDIATKQISEISLTGGNVSNGDGLLLKGRTLYVVQNFQNQIAEVKLSGDLSSGKIVSLTTDPSFQTPTTIAEAQGRLLVVNSQFANTPPGIPPFTVSSIKLP